MRTTAVLTAVLVLTSPRTGRLLNGSLIVRLPGTVSPGSVCRQPVLSTDFDPTILELTGTKGDARHNAALDGTSLVPLLKDPATG